MQGEIGFKAAHIVMELMKDNKKIVDRITHSHIDQYVELLNKNKVCGGPIQFRRSQFYIS